jgi:signal transduction histidine kinase
MRLRLILLAGAISSLLLVAFLVPLALLVRSEAAARATSSAVVAAQALAPTVATADEATLALAVAQANATGTHPVTVYLPDGRTVGAAHPVTPAVRLAGTGQSLTADVDGGREVVVAVAGLDGGTAVIRAFVPEAELTAGVGRSWAVLGILGLGLLAVSLLVADLLARRLIRPLSAVAEVSHRLAEGSLGARAETGGPHEVRQVSAGLNLLAGRITELLAQERATVADLSHRLRTPLTALRVDLEALVDPMARDRLMADLDAVDRTVDEVIREADRPVRQGVAVACDAAAVVADRWAFWVVVAEEQRRRVHVSVPSRSVPVRLSGRDLSACVDALIGNVFAHTPVGTAFEVNLVGMPGGGGRLVVSDAGAGMPRDAVQRGASGGGSTGLGLDIVARTAAASGGSLRLGRSAAGGAEVTMDLGPPAPTVIRSHARRSRSR